MTQEELLERLSYPMELSRTYPITKALRAVVELHKPIEVPHDNYKSSLGCSSPDCIDHYNEPIEYPCATIQAIEKALV